MKIFLKLTACVLLTTGAVSATKLSDAVNAMAPKSWRPIIGSSGGANFFTGSNNPITIYSNDCVWEPNSEKFLYVGSPHAQPFNMVIYTAATDNWKNGPLHSEINSIHSYDNNTVDEQAGIMYYWPNHSPLLKFDPNTEQWSTVSGSSSGAPGSGYGSALEYFPERKGLVYVFGGSVEFFSLQSNSWSSIGTYAMGGYHNLAEYNPVHKFLIFGGGNGSRQMYRMDSTGQVTTLPQAPVEIGINTGNLTVDPVTGNYLYLMDDSLYEWNVLNGSWKGTVRNLLPGFFNVVSTPVAKYGVVAFLTAYNYPLLLYKHAQASAVEKAGPAGARILSAAPNPARNGGRVLVTAPGGLGWALSVVDASGKRVADFRGETGEWRPENLANGIYFLRAARRGEALSLRLVLLN